MGFAGWCVDWFGLMLWLVRLWFVVLFWAGYCVFLISLWCLVLFGLSVVCVDCCALFGWFVSG